MPVPSCAVWLMMCGWLAWRAGLKGRDAANGRTLGDLETMLLLRRVPLFEGLDPEDLADRDERRGRLPGGRHPGPRGDLTDAWWSSSAVRRVVHIGPTAPSDSSGAESGVIGELAALREHHEPRPSSQRTASGLVIGAPR
jgi:hypothetical protein